MVPRQPRPTGRRVSLHLVADSTRPPLPDHRSPTEERCAHAPSQDATANDERTWSQQAGGLLRPHVQPQTPDSTRRAVVCPPALKVRCSPAEQQRNTEFLAHSQEAHLSQPFSPPPHVVALYRKVNKDIIEASRVRHIVKEIGQLPSLHWPIKIHPSCRL
ncbi:uncharacterized protein LOC144139832 [Haemaphysalis longicornis]